MEELDLVDVYRQPFVRPLGNLVLTFTKAEAAVLEFCSELLGGDEFAAATLLSKPDRAKDDILALVDTSGLANPQFAKDAIKRHWTLRDQRHRLMHDEFFVGITEEATAIVGLRGFTRGKNPQLIWGEPEISEIWRLAHAFRDIAGDLEAEARAIRDQREAAE